MTPCEVRGYKVGDLFAVRTDLPAQDLRECLGFEPGQIITLYRDEGDSMPLFKGDNSQWDHADGEPGAFVHVDLVTKVEDVA